MCLHDSDIFITFAKYLKQHNMLDKIRIKDIAERAGISVGTVDRVLHNRPNVSKTARDKIEKVLKELNYQPNMYASALAYNKSYTLCLFRSMSRKPIGTR